jgi:UDP-N-acetyl-D-galactosamine dehydrogenase
MIHTDTLVKGAKVIVLGLTFKENCADLRNSKVVNVVRELESFGCNVMVHDPVANAAESQHEYGIELTEWENLPKDADAVVAAVMHTEYLSMPLNDITGLIKKDGVFIDIKSAFDQEKIRAAGFRLWRL